MILRERPLYLLFNLWLKPTLRAEPPFDFLSGEEKLGTAIIYRMEGAGWAEDFLGGSLDI